MKMTFRWYGETDSISLSKIRQIPGMSGVVTAVYSVPVGEVWPEEDIIRHYDITGKICPKYFVEDEENINNLLKNLLETSGYQVICAKSCSSGQMLFTSHRPDLVILDLGLPDFDGMTFLKSIRKDSLTPVIVLSARTDE